MNDAVVVDDDDGEDEDNAREQWKVLCIDWLDVGLQKIGVNDKI